MKYVESTGRGQRVVREAKKFLCVGTCLVRETYLLGTQKFEVAMAFKVYPVEMRPQQWMRWRLRIAQLLYIK